MDTTTFGIAALQAAYRSGDTSPTAIAASTAPAGIRIKV